MLVFPWPSFLLVVRLVSCFCYLFIPWACCIRYFVSQSLAPYNMLVFVLVRFKVSLYVK